jgi:hypothetical protein
MHNLFVVYFVSLYRFRVYLGPSSGGTTVCIQQLVLIVLFRWLSDCSNPTRTTDSHLKGTPSTNCCVHTVVPPDDGPRYAPNPTRATDNHLKRTLSTNCCIHTVAPPDDGPRYAPNPTCPYAELDRSSLCPQIPHPEDPYNYYSPIYAWVFQLVSFPQDSPPKPCIHLFSTPYVLHAPPISFFLTWSGVSKLVNGKYLHPNLEHECRNLYKGLILL